MILRGLPDRLPRRQAFLLLRYTLIIAVAYLLLVEHEFSSLPALLILLTVAALTSNIVVARLPARITDSTAFNAGIIVADTIWITAALLYSRLFGAEFFYLYFFILLVAAIGENLALIAVGAVVVCTAYLFVLTAGGGLPSLWSSPSLIRIPFLFTVALFYGHLVDRVRREQQRAREEAHAVARLEDTQRQLADRALHLERANAELEREISRRKEAEETLWLIVEGTSQVIGGDFLRSLVRHLATTLQLRFAFISELLDEEGKRLRTLALWTGTGFGENFEYDTRGTPCEQVIIAKGASYFPEGVQELFPEDRWLAEAGVESYLGIPFFTASGHLIGHLGVMDDKPMEDEHRVKSILTIFAARVGVELERTRAAEALEATQLQLIQCAKLESVGQLAAGVAHEVKNPLAIIQQGLAYVSQSVAIPGDDTTAQVFAKMDNAVRRADQVIKGLLHFAAPGAVDMAPAQLNAVVEQALLLVNHELARAQITVLKALGESLPPITLDRHKIEQVFVNLFMNAIHAMPGGGTLTVKTHTKRLTAFGPDGGRRATDPFRNGDTVVSCEVEDTGSGIPAEKLDRVFDPFFTTKPTGEGTGLGLTVTRKIMELHGGTIDIRNRQERGVRVTLTFKRDGGQGDAEETDSAH